jgi:superfamily II DNA/RNA helicase
MFRLLRFIETGKVLLDQVQYVVLDEADQMLDDGFGPDIEKLMNSPGMPPKTERTTLMFSYALSSAVIELSKKYQKEVSQYFEYLNYLPIRDYCL